MTLAAIGVVAGLAGAFSLTRVMASLLFNVRPDDPTTYLAISFLLIVVAFLACYLPARRAAQTRPNDCTHARAAMRPRVPPQDGLAVARRSLYAATQGNNQAFVSDESMQLCQDEHRSSTGRVHQACLTLSTICGAEQRNLRAAASSSGRVLQLQETIRFHYGLLVGDSIKLDLAR